MEQVMESAVKDPTYVENQRDETAGSMDPLPGAGAAQTARRPPGQRALSDQEREQRQIALCATVPDKQQAMCQCSKVIHYSVFFDGTGNNRFDELAKSRISRRFRTLPSCLMRTRWICPRESFEVMSRASVLNTLKSETRGGLAQAIGTGGKERIKKALDMLGEEIAKVPSSQKVRLINVVVFGFSRGAAEARAFIRDLAAKCTAVGGAYRYKDIPLRVAFVGVFDTVCSAYDGLPSAAVTWNGGHNGWADGMKLPPMVEQCVHMMAAHEARRRFPLDSTRIDAAYPDNTIEIWYPGVHADVGGGYSPMYQGRENTVSRFALNEMFDLAFAAGVLFNLVETLPGRVRDEFNKDDPKLREAFSAYLSSVPLKTGPMEEVQAAHMELLHRWVKERIHQGDSSESVQRLKQKMLQARKAKTQLERRRQAILAQAIIVDPTMPPILPADKNQEYDQINQEIRKVDEAYDEADSALSDLGQEDVKFEMDAEAIAEKARQGWKLTLRREPSLEAWQNETPCLTACANSLIYLRTIPLRISITTRVA
jgi:hypothetical protein